ncbi:hypothetical protein B0H14DRAFT_1498862 [Mycena olivaceomarginata]|nr:hypothetical protein B0H14DRAFT_1498862 [Mycena olivaceomarginata]
MPRLRLFGSSTNEWVSPLVLAARGLVSVGNCVPFPFVNTALSSGLALLELIQTVGQSGDDMKYLAESVVTIMKLLREEMDLHPTTENTKFAQVCEEFTEHLMQLSKDLESMSKNWSSSKFRKYLNSHNIREEISLFTRRVSDLRANATLIAAAGTRMDLAPVVTGVAAVESKIDGLHRQLVEQRSSLVTSAAESLKQELTRFEEDFHALKLGDIHLDFCSARVANFSEFHLDGREKKEIGWTDYKATVNGCIRTVRVYQGSDSTKSWKGFLSFLADNSPSPHLAQLFGFCSSPRLQSLVFHGEYRSLDEYGSSLQSAQAIVDWELGLVVDFFNMLCCRDITAFPSNRKFAMVNEDGKFVLTHVDKQFTTSTCYRQYPPFLAWFATMSFEDAPVAHITALRLCQDNCHGISDQHGPLVWSAGNLRETLGSLVALRRIPFSWYLPVNSSFCRGCVYHYRGGPPVAQLVGDRAVTPEDSWNVEMVIDSEMEWPNDDCFPVVNAESRGGFTHFIVPLARKIQKWISLHDGRPRCGYFLNAKIEFGRRIRSFGVLHP